MPAEHFALRVGRKRFARKSRERAGGGRTMAAIAAATTSLALPNASLPISEAAIDAATTLATLRTYEESILQATRRHEDALARLQGRYRSVRAKMYREHKRSVIAEDNARLSQFQGGCSKLPPGKPTKSELDANAKCLQAESGALDDSELGRLMRAHLWAQPTAASRCEPFGQVAPSQLSPVATACARTVGAARWTASGLVSTNATDGCARRWQSTSDARCLLAGKDVLFIGNSVVRRQMYTVLELLAGPRAHRQLRNFSAAWLPDLSDTGADRAEASRSWVWDQDNSTYGYHAAQLITVDLATGDHRFEMPHVSLCGVSANHAVFNSGRMRQWRSPGAGTGSEKLGASWQRTKWAAREWRPTVSFHLSTDRDASSDACDAVQLNWAGATDGSVSSPPPPAASSSASQRRRRRREAQVKQLRKAVHRELRTFFSRDARDWLSNVSIHVEMNNHARATKPGGGRARGPLPNVWIYFPTYHGERERFNGFCEDKPCTCTNELATCHRHPECRGKHTCAPLSSGSSVFVEHARSFAASLVKRSKLLGHTMAAVRVSPVYDDCWPSRGRCQGMRPCKEPVDAAWTCRSTAMLCPAAGEGGWPAALQRAKAWVPQGHPSASLLYLYDGQTSELLEETFSTWSEASVGYGSHAIIFGPQFGAFHHSGSRSWRRTLSILTSAVRRSDSCVGRRTLVVFRSPAFNFDPVNSPKQQSAFSSLMRPLVDEFDIMYIDNYEATHNAVFQQSVHAIKFAKNSAFHYLNAGRYLMSQLLLHALMQTRRPAD